MSAGPAGHVTRSSDIPNSETAGRTSSAPPRTPLRRFLRTDDGVNIEAVYNPKAVVYKGAAGTGTPSSGPLAFIVAHGFTGHVDRPHVRRVAQALTRYGSVVTFSFRGHGRSGGRSTVGDREVLDLAAAVRWARALGHERVATVGFSMGGSVVLRHAALPDGPDAVVSVSAPARWYYRGTASMRRVHWLITRPEGRLLGRCAFRTRIHHRDWDPVPLSPVESVPLIAPTPLLVVHGDSDGYFPTDHPAMLAAAAGENGELWLERGMGHAENAASAELLARVGEWVAGRAR
ncbi:alpha/beta fold hydrolase [Streptomyces scabiei]|uniref:alpha/beta hydrolase n=1 Tax=Streptomyces scabiei TaxID=1930 RepID=UPI001B316B39|nr:MULTISPECIES: alpha/beta fold hydrolase [Streptomyces]MDW8473933.1 alpha/beta fold hydrolase [Streptomyces scabiei]MDX2572922.1 alpha/beta fold hydrolase [Streptomyces scabiei]MDX3160073.1 alpha/beta fold hydrolase [Streptomyces scabiei]MDX3165219.1 alpha/beta fold hydrolase [Streptomyces scabiei]MDX3252612.1 alpha/beta fold hydrolase [Streptomyces scabiei]